MHRLNFDQAYCFYLVAKNGSIKSVTKILNITQPAVSNQIKTFEENLGVKLFVRKHRQLELTEKGKWLLPRIEHLLLEADALVAKVKARPIVQRKKVRIGAVMTLSNSFIHDFSKNSWRRSADFVSIIQGEMESLMHQLSNDDLDLILSDVPYGKSRVFKSTQVTTDSLIAVCSPSLTLKKAVFPKCLDRAPYMGYADSKRLQEDIDHYFAENLVEPELVGEANDVSIIKMAAESGACFAILPKRAVQTSIRGKTLRVLGSVPGVHRSIWAITSANSTKKQLLQNVIRHFFS